MKPLSEFLTEREIYVLNNHPQKTYKTIGEELGVANTRIRQIKVNAERKIREEKRREQVEEAGQIPVSVTVQRKELWVIYRALHDYYYKIERKHQHGYGLHWEEFEPDLKVSRALLTELEKLLNQDPEKPSLLLDQNEDYLLIEEQQNKR